MIAPPTTLIVEPCDHTSPALEIILARVPGLPPAVHILPKLLAALGDEDTDRNEDDSAACPSGLLHESGKIVMAQAFREHYAGMLATCAHSPDQLVSQEREPITIISPAHATKLRRYDSS
jgi:hypothetical protein